MPNPASVSPSLQQLNPENRAFVEIATHEFKLSESGVKRALTRMAERNLSVAEAFTQQALLTPTQIEVVTAHQIAKMFDKSFIDLSNRVPQLTQPERVKELRSLFPADKARQANVFPIGKSRGTLHLVCCSAGAIPGLEAALFSSDIDPTKVKLSVTTPGAYRDIFEAIYADPSASEPTFEQLSDSMRGGSAPEGMIAKLVDKYILGAVLRGASDVSFEPNPGELRVRYRIDGVWEIADKLPDLLTQNVVARCKTMAEIDPTKKMPLDGRIKLKVRGRNIDLRVATVPVQGGDKVTLRILDQSRGMVSISALGLDKSEQEWFEKLIREPQGVVLLTGPTGSGKTTTLYSALVERNTDDTNILTVEDPVEYRIPGINQVGVNEKMGVTFSSALTSFLRHQPDIILVGEVRDEETAKIAMQAAATGHLVFSTVHTNSAISTISRLADLIKDKGDLPAAVRKIRDSVRGIIAQRLVRTLCDTCSEPDPDAKEKLRVLRVKEEQIARLEGRIKCSGSNQDCEDCGGKGYSGRIAIVETLAFERDKNPVLRRTLGRDAFSKIAAGRTSFEEAERVIGGYQSWDLQTDREIKDL
ncbi:MAG: ATPase, T2SS/T4P/T4SS family [Bdellovibrionota bacterium]